MVGDLLMVEASNEVDFERNIDMWGRANQSYFPAFYPIKNLIEMKNHMILNNMLLCS